MKRPCSCDSAQPGEPFSRQRDCRACWLYMNRDDYRRLWSEPADAPSKAPRAPRPLLQSGPGTELAAILKELGVIEWRGCGCTAKVQQMNEWGVAGCRENFETIRGWLIEGQQLAGWGTRIKAAAAAATSGLFLQLDLLDIAGSLVRLALARSVARAEAVGTSPAA